jgi:four helix bundle protein
MKTTAGPRFVSFREVPVWQEAMAVAEQVFALTDRLPRKEDYGFTSQIRRAALSISANIAEAFGRNHTLDKVNFYFVARGSVTETQSHLEYGKRVGYFKPKSAEELSARLSSVYNDINKVIITLRQKGERKGRGPEEQVKVKAKVESKTEGATKVTFTSP